MFWSKGLHSFEVATVDVLALWTQRNSRTAFHTSCKNSYNINPAPSVDSPTNWGPTCLLEPPAGVAGLAWMMQGPMLCLQHSSRFLEPKHVSTAARKCCNSLACSPLISAPMTFTWSCSGWTEGWLEMDTAHQARPPAAQEQQSCRHQDPVTGQVVPRLGPPRLHMFKQALLC